MSATSLRAFGAGVVTCVVLIGCSGSDGETTTPTQSTVGTEVSITVEAEAPTSSEAPTTAAPDEAPATSAPVATPTTEPQPLFGSFDQLIEIESQPGESPGRPELTWSAVDGVDHYGVYVYAPSGQIYWAWQGYDTSVPLGGDIGEAAGPSASAGMTWAVVAYDAELLPITVSNRITLGF